jgi:hypothetical protein
VGEPNREIIWLRAQREKEKRRQSLFNLLFSFGLLAIFFIELTANLRGYWPGSDLFWKDNRGYGWENGIRELFG